MNVELLGGDGSYHGAMRVWLNMASAIKVLGTIENDIVGVLTLQSVLTQRLTAMDAIYKIFVTSSRHRVTFVIEKLGRNAQVIALWAMVLQLVLMNIIPEKHFKR